MIISIAERRGKIGLTQEELAKRLGTDRTTVVKWEKGKSFPRPEMLCQLARVLGCTPNDLLGFECKPAEDEKPETRGQEISVRMSEAFADARKRQEA